MVIATFGDQLTDDLYNRRETARTRKVPPDLTSIAQRKLDMINAAADTKDLRVPPGNRLEQLKGKLKGWWSIRVNDQWRIVFRWERKDAYAVKFTDYH